MSRVPITNMVCTFIVKISKKRNRGVNDEPFLLKDSYHAWEATYDERGQQSEKSISDSMASPFA